MFTRNMVTHTLFDVKLIFLFKLIFTVDPTELVNNTWSGNPCNVFDKIYKELEHSNHDKCTYKMSPLLISDLSHKVFELV